MMGRFIIKSLEAKDGRLAVPDLERWRSCASKVARREKSICHFLIH